MAEDPTELAPGLWRWATRHPEWHPGTEAEGPSGPPEDARAGDRFGAEVGCYALIDHDDRLLLIDPQLPEAEDRALRADQGGEPSPTAVSGVTAVPMPLLDWLDGLALDREVLILLTLGYHVRSAEPLHRRYGCEVWGPAEADRRLDDDGLLHVYSPDEPGPAGVTAFAFGSPPRGERALYLPSHRAVAFGDIVVATPAGELRLWEQGGGGPGRAEWYRQRFVPTFAPLLDHPIERVLVTHGEPVLTLGGEALTGALEAGPWEHPG